MEREGEERECSSHSYHLHPQSVVISILNLSSSSSFHSLVSYFSSSILSAWWARRKKCWCWFLRLFFSFFTFSFIPFVRSSFSILSIPSLFPSLSLFTYQTCFFHHSSSFSSFLLLSRQSNPVNTAAICSAWFLRYKSGSSWLGYRQVFEVGGFEVGGFGVREERVRIIGSVTIQERVIIIGRKIPLIVIVWVAGSNEKEEKERKKRNMRIGESSDWKKDDSRYERKRREKEGR